MREFCGLLTKYNLCRIVHFAVATLPCDRTYNIIPSVPGWVMSWGNRKFTRFEKKNGWRTDRLKKLRDNSWFGVTFQLNIGKCFENIAKKPIKLLEKRSALSLIRTTTTRPRRDNSFRSRLEREKRLRGNGNLKKAPCRRVPFYCALERLNPFGQSRFVVNSHKGYLRVFGLNPLYFSLLHDQAA